MRAALLERPGVPLRIADVPAPAPGPGDVLVRVEACGVCRTDLHIADGELPAPRLPLVLGHQIVGRLAGDGGRVGIPWVGWTCGVCRFCRSGHENLCDRALFTGLDRDGGFAELTVADERHCLALPDDLDALDAAPLLCAGLIGHRALRMAGDGERLGLYGFGAAAHIVCQVARWEGRQVFAITRDGDDAAQRLARDLGATWTGGMSDAPPEELDAAIIFAPAGELVPLALGAVRKGGTVVCAGIHMTDIPSFPYALLWGERVLRSVANLTRADGEDFLRVAARVPVRTTVTPYALEEADHALADLRLGVLTGAAVIDLRR